ncbi:VOC family protein [Ulvibacterium sp.]|uniref:VOC family protein n=1 Tax=Ulvibacterium sp. TaxID=2665914 RepID=UPI003BA99086
MSIYRFHFYAMDFPIDSYPIGVRKTFLLWVTAIIFGFGFGSKSILSQEILVDNAFEEQTTALRLDHFFLWVKDPDAIVKRLESIGFTAIPDSLSTIHQGQGTAGRYFYFLNAYFEFLFVHDREALIANDEEYGFLETQKRVDYENTNASAFGVGLQMENYDPSRIPFGATRFYQTYLPDDSYLYFATSSDQLINEPLTFVVCPELQNIVKDSNDLARMSEQMRGFYEHDNKAKRVSKITITLAHKGPLSKAMDEVNKMQNVEIVKGKEQLLEIYFDNGTQGKFHDLRPQIPVLIYL